MRQPSKASDLRLNPNKLNGVGERNVNKDINQQNIPKNPYKDNNINNNNNKKIKLNDNQVN